MCITREIDAALNVGKAETIGICALQNIIPLF
jgi:hypothetical protein